MNRIASWLVVVAAAIAAAGAGAGFPHRLHAQGLDCANFWVNPETGQEECINSNSPLQLTSPTIEFPDADPVAFMAAAKATLERQGQDFALRYLNRNEKTYLAQAYTYCRRRRNGESHSDITRDYTHNRPSTPYVPGVSSAEYRLRTLNASLARKHLCPDVNN